MLLFYFPSFRFTHSLSFRLFFFTNMEDALWAQLQNTGLEEHDDKDRIEQETDEEEEDEQTNEEEVKHAPFLL